MTQYDKAYQEVNKELENAKIEQFKKELKQYTQEQLDSEERLKADKEKIEEKLRIIKLNLDNLKNGKFEAIEERMKKSEVARQLSNVNFSFIPSLWNDSFLNGTYITWNGKTFYF